ncbi:AbrB/MazE/SpoVT family DNA-binding domain-containing protein [Notoacmeibacter marinus]|uniref:AbrB/MazE/SpoVT family DNA-binding domain-containing protein n=1 Tax=Notoacmeibacter marinus TaxID=1876515 RepID=UPI0013B058D1|nr:AbrB/MazE/SpoVT family DNA-binding domain-containing protein [Notoacmeibacter marinus]
MHYDAKVTSKGQMTLPSEVRQLLSVEKGDTVRLIIQNNQVVLMRRPDIMDFAGALHDPNRKAVTIEEMNESIADAVVEGHECSVDRH